MLNVNISPIPCTFIAATSRASGTLLPEILYLTTIRSLPFLMNRQFGENAKVLLQTIELEFCVLNRQSKAIGAKGTRRDRPEFDNALMCHQYRLVSGIQRVRGVSREGRVRMPPLNEA